MNFSQVQSINLQDFTIKTKLFYKAKSYELSYLDFL